MNPYIPLLLLFLFGMILSGAFLALSHVLGPRKSSREKNSSYECGLEPTGNPHERFSVKFYLVAMLFILFDVEIVFLYPWAVLFKESIQSGMGSFFFFEMIFFMAILLVGLIYVYGRKAIEWE